MISATEVDIRNRSWTSAWTCELLRRERAARLICGYIDTSAIERLTAEGVDIRLGQCAGPALRLVAEFDRLPKVRRAGRDGVA